ncbi:prolyl aminopeptidase [Streptomyces calidiresistens]|uniref:prolyl aminopeptidase n=1 Tax=Streptomyces calidiresistens TaxID=1485586 RepID=UPI002B2027AA|nr:prolyl aminopeptidase [Streptomyces calidiresistens]
MSAPPPAPSDVPHPPVEPYDGGLLDVGDGQRVHWETHGNPDGAPALVVHGGPGSGCAPRMLRPFDPHRYRVILFDQRGCGRSLPHASDPATGLEHNTTHHLIADMERLREHLGVERWVLFGGSWGSTLILAYAQRHPDRVAGIVIAGVTTTRHSEIDWLYRGTARFFPDRWERFLAPLPPTDREDPVAGYARLMNHPDAEVREHAAREWCAWEDTLVSLEPHGAPAPYSGRPDRDMMAMVRITTHYFAHAAWLEEGELLRNADRLTGIPGVLVHGRQDLSGPAITAWELARAWPDARLHIVEDAGHTGSDAFRRTVRTALDTLVPR